MGADQIRDRREEGWRSQCGAYANSSFQSMVLWRLLCASVDEGKNSYADCGGLGTRRWSDDGQCKSIPGGDEVRCASLALLPEEDAMRHCTRGRCQRSVLGVHRNGTMPPLP